MRNSPHLASEKIINKKIIIINLRSDRAGMLNPGSLESWWPAGEVVDRTSGRISVCLGIVRKALKIEKKRT